MGWSGCVDRVPLHLAFRVREGMWECCIVPAVSKMVFTPPPSRISSEGGWGGVGVLIEYPSISRFKEERVGWSGCVDRVPLCLAF